MLKDVVADRQGPEDEREPKLARNGPGSGRKQGARNFNGIPISLLAEELVALCLP